MAASPLYFEIILCIVVCLVGKSTAETECIARADVVFLVDSSTSIRETNPSNNSWDNWQIIKDFVANIAQQLPLREDAVKLGVIKFASYVDTEQVVGLGDYWHNEDLRNKIDNLEFQEGGTNTSGAIEHVLTDPKFFSPDSTSDRDSAKNIIILITDGLSNIAADKTRPVARRARIDHNIEVFTIGITEYANVDELQEIATDPSSYYTFVTEDFKYLNDITDRLLLRICRERPPPRAACLDERADVTFVLDSSGSIGEDNWITLKRFVVRVIASLDVGVDKTHIAIVTYSTNATVEFNFNNYFSASPVGSLYDMEQHILTLDYSNLKTNISGALRVMRQQVYSVQGGDRSHVQDIAILISDGKSTEELNQTSTEARLTRQQGIRVFALGLTTEIDDDELRDISSKPERDHFFKTADISTVDTLTSRLVLGVCDDSCVENVMDPKCYRNVSNFGCYKKEKPQWHKYPGSILLGHNYDRLENIATPEECKGICFRDPNCHSIDYVSRYHQCAVSYVTKDDSPLSFVEEEGADYYELTCKVIVPSTTATTVSGGRETTTRSSTISGATTVQRTMSLIVLVVSCKCIMALLEQLY